MEKSLLDLLLEEQKVVLETKIVSSKIDLFEEEKERILESEHSIYVDQSHIDFCNRQISACKQDMAKLNEKLLYIRRGMQEYVSWIITL